MKTRRMILSMAGILVPVFLGAQRLHTEVDFHYLFDNREFSRTGELYKPSQTITGAVFTPWIGTRFSKGETRHSLMFGLDFFRESGQEEGRSLWNETMFYWKSVLPLRRGGVFSGTAGIYPRKMLKGDYSQAFFSEETCFYDGNLEGMLFQWRKPGFSAELGLDWLGMKHEFNRERFQVFSSGEYSFSRVFTTGWSASMFHLASSEHLHSVVDNSLVEPWVRWNLTGITSMQHLSFKAGAMVAYQRDRNIMEKPSIPYGAEFTFTARKWNVELTDNLYIGDSVMPFYKEYLNLLYKGDAFYNLFTEDRIGVFNKLDIRYIRSFNGWLSVKSGVSVYNGRDGYLGWRQYASLIISLNDIK